MIFINKYPNQSGKIALTITFYYDCNHSEILNQENESYLLYFYF